MSQGSAWNSLEITQLVVSVLTPLTVAFLGVVVTRAAKRAEARAAADAQAVENAQWANRRAVERLIELHKELAPLLNDLMCFFRLIGHFREIDPPGALARKRRADNIFHVNEHLFGQAFRQKYKLFMRECFAQWESPGRDAKIKASADRLRAERGSGLPWDHGWNLLFQNVPDSRDRRHKQQAIYEEVMIAFAAELGLSRVDRHLSLD